jgi:hypothetical protein
MPLPPPPRAVVPPSASRPGTFGGAVLLPGSQPYGAPVRPPTTNQSRVPRVRKPTTAEQVLAVVSGLWAAWWFVNQLSRNNVWDDAYMFWRVAGHVLAGEGPVWNVSEGGGDPPAYGLTAPLYLVPVMLARILFAGNPALGLGLVSMAFGVAALWLAADRLSRLHWPIEHQWIALGLAAPTLFHHFISGMDTTFALCALVFYLRCRDWGPRLEPAWAFAFWFIRPELVLFPLARAAWGLIQLVLPEATPGASRASVVSVSSLMQGLVRASAIMAAVVAALLVAWAAFGSIVPLSALAKRAGYYGPEFTALYRGRAYEGAALAVAQVLPFAVGAVFVPPAVALAAATIAAYHTFVGLPVMGYAARFHWPAMLALALNPEHFIPGRWLGRFQPRRRQYLVGAALGVSVLSGLIAFAREPSTRWAHIGQFDVVAETVERRARYWPGLMELRALDGEIAIATTEVGRPAVLLPKTRLIDLSGLNEPRLTRDRSTVARLIDAERPDWIWLPHPDYATLVKQLTGDAGFRTEYEIFPAAALGTTMGVAILKTSPYAEDLKGIVEGVGGQHASERRP